MRSEARLAWLLVYLCAALPFVAQAAAPARYEPNWASVDSRPTPQWWTDAKFGIFIHWGVYSVPSFAPKGEYAEWYWNRLDAPSTPDQSPDGARIQRETRAFHERVYGKSFAYADFAPLFRAEMFDAGKWADILKGSGAKYVVLVSKHHDGFALWPSREADTAWGRPWNAVAVGPKRDLVGELTTAVRQRGLEMGFYFSLYEWFNPLWLSRNVDAYVERHLFPQFKDLVTRYSPSVIFADGEWEQPSEKWRAAELLAWLFNDSPVADKVVVNDRWGKETRHVHGGYYTTEYGAGLPGATHAWEENRGIGHSYGYNRNEDVADYATGERLLLTLIDTVSRGGNLLLNIGPTADGRIPVEMQERLAYLGTWLERNGEAIYGTRTFRDGAQWSAGRRQEVDTSTNYRARYDVEKITLNPDAGDARKEIMFTRKGDTLYAILPRPAATFSIRDLQMTKGARVSLLGGAGTPVKWQQRGGDLVVSAPAQLELPVPGPRVFRIEGAALR
ncbi:MAG TPA: alpha-L-fucosidase [Steroidobacteraceae bacterium]|nr:alpha-L-fucosidase [Steroidobacteraceae bacterium]